jgi:hypothetical protein
MMAYSREIFQSHALDVPENWNNILDVGHTRVMRTREGTRAQASETGQGIASPQQDAGDERDANPPASIGRCPICGRGEMRWSGRAWRCDSAGKGKTCCSYGMTPEAYARKLALPQDRIGQLPARGTRRP